MGVFIPHHILCLKKFLKQTVIAKVFSYWKVLFFTIEGEIRATFTTALFLYFLYKFQNEEKHLAFIQNITQHPASDLHKNLKE